MWSAEVLLYTLLGLLVGYLGLGLWKRLSGMNEFSRIKASLTQFVSRDRRIHAMFPPSYLEKSGGVSCLRFHENWLGVSAAGVLEVKAGIEGRIERAAARSPSFAEPMRYAFMKSGKMIRARLVSLLGFSLNVTESRKLVLLAQAVELLHCASLLHDDVVDEADMRRGIDSHRKKFGDRTAVLTGDNLISILVEVLTDIGEMEVTETVSRAIEALVIGELLQLMVTEGSGPKLDGRIFPTDSGEKIDSDLLRGKIVIYLRKSFFKTASLFAALCQCVGLLAKLPKPQVDNLAAFGFFFGLAFQLVDDLLDLEPEDEDLTIGKPVGGSDIRNGTITLPVLLATNSQLLAPTERLELEKMIKRRFKLGGDPERALALIAKSDCVERSKKIVSFYIERSRYELVSVVGEANMGALDGLLRDIQSRKS